jgi:hypothetical protein
LQICFVFLIIAYDFSSKKLEVKEELLLPGTEGGWGEEERVGVGGKEWPVFSVCTCE